MQTHAPLLRLLQHTPDAWAAALLDGDGILIDMAQTKAATQMDLTALGALCAAALRTFTQGLGTMCPADGGPDFLHLALADFQVVCAVAHRPYFIVLVLQPQAIIARARFYTSLAAHALAETLAETA